MPRIESENVKKPNVLIVGIYSPHNPVTDIESYYQEFINLVHSNGIEYQEAVFFKLRSIDPGCYVTKGKLEELLELCKKHDIDQVIFSETLSPQQERNLDEMLNVQIFDRTQLILDIFEKGAHSAEGKTQVAIAMLKHKKSRLGGKGVHMSQQFGMIGMRGPGETAKEKETQHIERLISKLERDLDRLSKVRDTQRKKRLTSQIPLFCLVGYTNAGKSTILNALTHAGVLAEDKLFATLDTTTRELYIDGKKKGLISDTVGFIQQLPHNLIEAFKSTLKELEYASLLLHVIDVSDKNFKDHIKVVMETLKDINVDRPMLYIFNKIDKSTENHDAILKQIANYHPHIVISATSKEGIEPLVDYLRYWENNSVKKEKKSE